MTNFFHHAKRRPNLLNHDTGDFVMSIKLQQNRIKANFWITPSLYGIAAFVLATISTFLDRYLTAHKQWLKLVPSVFLTDKELAHTILSSVSNSLLTMTTITFSSVLVVLTTFVGQFSPRTIQNFNTDAKTQRVLGTFIGGYVYVLVVLIQVRSNQVSNTFIVPSLAIVVAFICLGMFVFLIHHVINWIKVGNLISNIAKKTMITIEERRLEQQKTPESKNEIHLDFGSKKTIQIKSIKQGYIQYIELKHLTTLASKLNVIVKLEKAPGEYVEADTPLLTVINHNQTLEHEKFLHCLFITNDQESIQDVKLGIQKLSEIALRAISPAINDPETAINCIEQLTQVFIKLGKSYSSSPYYCDEAGRIRVMLEKPSFMDYLYKAFYQIRHYGKEDVSVMSAVIKALTVIAETNRSAIKNDVWVFSSYIVEGLQKEEWLKMDKEFLNQLLKNLAKACEKKGASMLIE